jgi:hypothetical protein
MASILSTKNPWYYLIICIARMMVLCHRAYIPHVIELCDPAQPMFKRSTAASREFETLELLDREID